MHSRYPVYFHRLRTRPTNCTKFHHPWLQPRNAMESSRRCPALPQRRGISRGCSSRSPCIPSHKPVDYRIVRFKKKINCLKLLPFLPYATRSNRCHLCRKERSGRWPLFYFPTPLNRYLLRMHGHPSRYPADILYY